MDTEEAFKASTLATGDSQQQTRCWLLGLFLVGYWAAS